MEPSPQEAQNSCLLKVQHERFRRVNLCKVRGRASLWHRCTNITNNDNNNNKKRPEHAGIWTQLQAAGSGGSIGSSGSVTSNTAMSISCIQNSLKQLY